MKPFKGFFFLFCVLALAAMACGVSVDLGAQATPTSVTQLSVQEEVGTGVAQALGALTEQAGLVTPTYTSTPLATATPVTPVVSQPPLLSVSVATNCYAGPSSSYGFVITIQPGTVVTVQGQDPADGYWVIGVPGYPGSLCWLSGQYASVTGQTAYLYYPATPAVPVYSYSLDEPRNLRASCTANYTSFDHGGWWNDGGHGGDPPPWGKHPPSPTPTSHPKPPPWDGHTPRPTRTPDGNPPPWDGHTPWPTRTPGGHQPPWGGQAFADATPSGNSGSQWASGVQGDFATPWITPTPAVQAQNHVPDGQQGSIGADWVSYGGWDHITSWTIDLKWKNTDPDQTGVRIYKNGRRIATLGKNASSYTDTISDNWHDDITYGVQVFNSYAVSSIVSIDVSVCK